MKLNEDQAEKLIRDCQASVIRLHEEATGERMGKSERDALGDVLTEFFSDSCEL